MAKPPNQIAAIRKKRGLSQQELAEKLGVHWVTVSKIERGKQKLTTEWMDRIAAVLEVGRWVLLGSTEPLITVNVSGQLTPSGEITDVPPDQFRTRNIYRWTLNHPDAIWVIVGDQGFSSLFAKGDLLEFFLSATEPKHYVGRLCYVRTIDEGSYFGLLARGSSPPYFDIIVAGQPTIKDVRVARLAQLTTAMFEQPDAVYGIDEEFWKSFEEDT
jgi:transcriptional regulator with XRE-family HTH domain